MLLLPNAYPPRLGGLETVVHTLAQHLLGSDHQVQVVTQRYPRPLPAREILDGVPVQRWLLLDPELGDLRRGRADLFLASLLAQPVARWRLDRLVRAFQPQVVNVHFPDHQTPLVLWLRQRCAFRLVVSLHGDEVLRWTRGDRRPGSDNRELERLRKLLREADAITACSRYLLDQALGLEPTVAVKGHVIHNGVDLQRFTIATAFEHPRPYLLAIGRLSYVKGFDLLLAAFARVAGAYPSLDLIIAGDGEERAALAARASALDVAERVRFPGRVTPDEIVRLLNGCQFLVVPSRRETFGITALEALAAGKQVVATRVGGLPEFLTEPANYLVPPTVEGLAVGLAALLGQPAEQRPTHSQANRRLAARFAWPKVAEAYLRVLCPPEVAPC